MYGNVKTVTKHKKATAFKRRGTIYFWIVSIVLVIIPFLVWWLYVNASTLTLGFREYHSDGTYSYGFENFKWAIHELTNVESDLRIGVQNTIILWLCSTFIAFPLTYLTSIFLYKRVAGYKVFKFIFFMPSVISAVVLTSFFKFGFMDGGPLTELLKAITGEEIYLFQNSDTAMTGIIIYSLWTFGAGFVLWVAQFSRIPEDILEYAKLDGVNWWQEMTHIIFPLTTSFFSLQLFNMCLGILSADAPILLLTQGSYGTMTIGYWNYINTLGTDASQARVAAFGLLLTAISVPIALIVRHFTNKIEVVEY